MMDPTSVHHTAPRHAQTTDIMAHVKQVASALNPKNRGPQAADVQWLNFAVEEIWPFVVKSVEKLMKEDVQQQLQASVPGPFKGIRFSQFSLGTNPPKLGPVNVNRVGNSGGEKDRSGHPGVELGIGVDWDCNANISLHVTGANVGIRKLNLKGEVFIILCPLMDSLPIVGGLQITMVSPPKISWEFTGIAQVVDMPQIARALKDIIANRIAELLVLPNRIFIHWVWGREHEIDISAMQYPMPEALLRIGIVEARGLEGKDWNLLGKATSDPYAKVTMGDREYQTPVIQKCLEPKWNDDGYFDFLMYTAAQHLTVDLFDHDLWTFVDTTDDFLGELVTVSPDQAVVEKIRLCDMLTKPDAWWPIYCKKGKKYEQSGEVHIKIESYALRAKKSVLEKPFPPHHGKANADCLLSVQLRGLRGLPKKFAAGAVIECKVLDKQNNEKSKFVSIKSTYLEEVWDKNEIDADPTVQRLVEYLKYKGTSLEDIVQVSGLTHQQVQRIVERRPSFHSKFNQSIHLPVNNPKELKLRLKLIVDGDTKHAATIQAEDFVLEDKLFKNDELEFNEILQLKRAQDGIAGIVEGPFELDIRIQLHGLVHVNPGEPP